MHKSPLDFVVSSVERKGGKGGCKITTGKHTPLNRSTELTTKSPFVKGDLKNNGKYFSMKRGILREYKDIKKSVGKRLVFSMQCFFYFGRV